MAGPLRYMGGGHFKNKYVTGGMYGPNQIPGAMIPGTESTVYEESTAPQQQNINRQVANLQSGSWQDDFMQKQQNRQMLNTGLMQAGTSALKSTLPSLINMSPKDLQYSQNVTRGWIKGARGDYDTLARAGAPTTTMGRTLENPGFGTGIGTAMDIGGQFAQQRWSDNDPTTFTGKEKAGRMMSSAGKGMSTGAQIGSIVPGVGTAIGAGIGTTIGAVTGLLKGKKEQREAQEELAKRNRQRAGLMNRGAQLRSQEKEYTGYDFGTMRGGGMRKMYNHGGSHTDDTYPRDTIFNPLYSTLSYPPMYSYITTDPETGNFKRGQTPNQDMSGTLLANPTGQDLVNMFNFNKDIDLGGLNESYPTPPPPPRDNRFLDLIERFNQEPGGGNLDFERVPNPRKKGGLRKMYKHGGPHDNDMSVSPKEYDQKLRDVISFLENNPDMYGSNMINKLMKKQYDQKQLDDIRNAKILGSDDRFGDVQFIKYNEDGSAYYDEEAGANRKAMNMASDSLLNENLMRSRNIYGNKLNLMTTKQLLDRGVINQKYANQDKYRAGGMYHAGGLYHNINHKKKSGTSRSKSNSTISDKAYANMKAGFPKKMTGGIRNFNMGGGPLKYAHGGSHNDDKAAMDTVNTYMNKQISDFDYGIITGKKIRRDFPRQSKMLRDSARNLNFADITTEQFKRNAEKLGLETPQDFVRYYNIDPSEAGWAYRQILKAYGIKRNGGLRRKYDGGGVISGTNINKEGYDSFGLPVSNSNFDISNLSPEEQAQLGLDAGGMFYPPSAWASSGIDFKNMFKSLGKGEWSDAAYYGGMGSLGILPWLGAWGKNLIKGTKTLSKLNPAIDVVSSAGPVIKPTHKTTKVIAKTDKYADAGSTIDNVNTGVVDIIDDPGFAYERETFKPKYDFSKPNPNEYGTNSYWDWQKKKRQFNLYGTTD